jgi:hypothetical protein
MIYVYKIPSYQIFIVLTQPLCAANFFMSLVRQLLKHFTTHELMRWPKIEEIYRAELQKLYIFNPATPAGQKHWKDLHHRVIEHVRHFLIR